MRKIFIILFLFILSTTSVKSNNHQIKREGFLSKDFKITKLSTIENAENKIILINNHGQNTNDGKQKGCTSIDQIRNRVSLIDEKVKGKTDVGKIVWIPRKLLEEIKWNLYLKLYWLF